MTSTLAAGLLAGLAASGHCVLMCGPLALAHAGMWRRADGRSSGRGFLLVHAGRLATYGALGIAAGTGGLALLELGAGRWLAWIAAAALLVAALGRSDRLLPRAVSNRLSKSIVAASGRSAEWARAHRIAGPVAAGSLNGLLPCGLVYAACAAAIGLGAPLDSAAFMIAFGVGTTPALAAVALTRLSPRGDQWPRQRWLRPAGLLLLAVMLIARGFHGPIDHSPGRAPADVTHAHR